MSQPIRLLATWFGSGLLPWAPGTWGSLAALPLAALLVWLGGWLLLAVGILAVSGLGWWICNAYIEASGRDDPKEVVIDEVAGQWLPLLVVPFDATAWFGAFLAFRLFDVVKPWPVSWADRRVKGGAGVMADDILAGVYAALLLIALSLLLEI